MTYTGVAGPYIIFKSVRAVYDLSPFQYSINSQSTLVHRLLCGNPYWTPALWLGNRRLELPSQTTYQSILEQVSRRAVLLRLLIYHCRLATKIRKRLETAYR